MDEDHCELSQLNECEKDEYRCANGTYIPEENCLDSVYDCIDWMHELRALFTSRHSCFRLATFICDEHLCLYNQWSCDDAEFSLLLCLE